jgi:hypothetical protein
MIVLWFNFDDLAWQLYHFLSSLAEIGATTHRNGEIVPLVLLLIMSAI